MKKLMCLLTITAMLSNSALATSTTTETGNHEKMIAKAFNEFRYKMTVEVDPKDPNFNEKAVSDFKKKISTLQSQGVSPAEIMQHMRVSMLDSASRSEFDRMLESMDQDQLSGEEAGNLAMKFMATKYQQGASYSGGGSGSYKWALIAIGVVIVGVVTYCLIKHYRDQRTKTETKTNTRTDTQTETETETNTQTNTITETSTNTNTNTNTNYGYCCNTVTGIVVPASITGCANGVALTFVASPELCVVIGPPGQD